MKNEIKKTEERDIDKMNTNNAQPGSFIRNKETLEVAPNMKDATMKARKKIEDSKNKEVDK